MDKRTYFQIQANIFSEEERAWCARQAEELWPEEKAHILRIAEEAVRLEFLFDLPWDMEQTREIVRFQYPVNWTYMPEDDPEFIYQMNRHRYLICLGQAYAMTSDEKYADTFVHILEDWIEHVPLNEESRAETWRELEAGIRGENWTKAIRYFRDSPAVTDGFVECFTESLKEHGEYLMGSTRGFLISSNWGVIANSGLFLIGRALENEAYMEEALKRLCVNARVQVFPDGVHWEQSCMYHNEVLHCFLVVMAALQASGKETPDPIRRAAAEMASADLAWVKPDGCQPLMGDSDDTGLRDVFSFAAVVLYREGYREQAELLKGCGYGSLDFESLWDLGRGGAEAYRMIDGRKPEQTDYFLEESGNYILRTGWEEDAFYLRFRNGCLGGGHGHNDRLHLDLAWGGEDILVDAGRYRYTYHEEDRVWLKSALAHNTILVDGKDYMEYPDSWGTRNLAPELRFPALRRAGITLLEGAHTGYLQNGTAVLLNRKVLVSEPGLCILADTVYTEESHVYSRLFHFSEQGKVTCTQNRVLYNGKKVKAELVFPDGDTELTPVRSRISKHYNTIEENAAVKADNRAEGRRTLFTVIGTGGFRVKMIPVDNPVTSGTLSDRDAQALEICTESHTYTVIFRHRDLSGPSDLLRAGNCMGIGRILIAEDEKEPVVFG